MLNYVLRILDIIVLLRLRYLVTPRRKILVETPSLITWRKIALERSTVLKIGEKSRVYGSLNCQKPGAVLSVGRRVFVGARTLIVSTSSVRIGDNVLIAHECYITDTDGHSLNQEIRRRDVPERWKGYKDWGVVISEPVVIDEDAWIGPNSIILKGVTIGEGAIVGAGSVVTSSVDPFTLVAGNPAKVVRSLERYGEGTD